MPIDRGGERRCRESFVRHQAGASVTAMDASQCEIMLPFSAQLSHQHGFIHAGITAMIVDTATGLRV
jgi:acyl-coenzyme A thioesterase PaaI-like protein